MTKHDSLDGRITWLLPDGSEVSQSEVHAIIRSSGEIAFDCGDNSDPAEPIRYTVVLNPSEADLFVGSFQRSPGGKTPSGPVSCRLYSSTSGFALAGNWSEEGRRYEWFAELANDLKK